MKKRVFFVGTVLFFFVFLAPLTGYADGPWTMSYYGYLEMVPDESLSATVEMTFSLYDTLQGTDPLWTEVHHQVDVKNGFYKVTLGSITPLDLACDSRYFIGIKVKGAAIPEKREAMQSVDGCLEAEIGPAATGSVSPAEGSGPELMQEGLGGGGLVAASAGIEAALPVTATMDNRNLKELETDLSQALNNIEDVSVQRLSGALLLTIQAEVLFARKAKTLKPDGDEPIRRIASILNQHPLTNIHIAVYSDSIGFYRYSEDLTECRAAAVKAAFVREGVKPERLSAAGMGEAKPLADNGLEAGRRVNRRVEITITSF